MASIPSSLKDAFHSFPPQQQPSLSFPLGLGEVGVHEICEASHGDFPAMTGFALAARTRRKGPVIWIRQSSLRSRSGPAPKPEHYPAQACRSSLGHRRSHPLRCGLTGDCRIGGCQFHRLAPSRTCIRAAWHAGHPVDALYAGRRHRCQCPVASFPPSLIPQPL